MKQAVPPWHGPAAVCVCCGGSSRETPWQTIGNDGTQSQRLLCGQAAQCSFGCNLAPHRKRWKRKARGYGRIPRALERRKREPRGLWAGRLLRSFGYRIPLRPNFCKERNVL